MERQPRASEGPKVRWHHQIRKRVQAGASNFRTSELMHWCCCFPPVRITFSISAPHHESGRFSAQIVRHEEPATSHAPVAIEGSPYPHCNNTVRIKSFVCQFSFIIALSTLYEYKYFHLLIWHSAESLCICKYNHAQYFQQQPVGHTIGARCLPEAWLAEEISRDGTRA